VKDGERYEVRRDIDIGPRTLKRGSRITLDELERLAPGKSGPLRRTGIIRLIGETDRERLHSVKDARKDRLHTAARADDARLAQFRKPGGSDE
jgi:hypothetical protein